MSSVIYEGKKVNNSIHDLKALSGRFPSVASRVQSLTSAMVSCKGFGYIGSGVSSTSFSGEINNCATELDSFVSKVRNMQVSILAYSNEDKDIQEFLDDLDKNEYKNLDLSGIESHIGVGRKLTNGFTSLAASLFTAGAGVVEGVCDFVETGADLLVLGKSAVSSIFTGTYDLITGSDTTKKMWEETKAYVSEKKVENAFNTFYNETEFGQSIKNNAYGFETVRGISSGLGYTAGLIGLNVVTGGLASGLGVGAAGSVGVGQLATTAGVMGFSSGTEDAWADGASIGKGLLYGAATGAWEGTQWAIGAKINQYGGVGDQIASGIFKGGRSGAVTRVVLDAADSGLEGFVQPGLKMIYKDYEGNTFSEKYQNAFQEAGGWSNVRNQAIMGGIMSAGSELMDARKILKSNSTGTDTSTAKAATLSGDEGQVEYRTALVSEDILEREIMEDQMAAAGNYSRNTRANIDGGYIRTADTEFNTSTRTGTIPSGSKKFLDGSYVPYREADGAFIATEKYYTGSTFSALLESKKDTLSGLDYTRFKDASEIFASHGKSFNMTELKLIINHSEGNIGRIKSAISMSDSTLMPQDLDTISKELAEKLFKRSSSNLGNNIERRIANSFIDDLRSTGRDTWKSGAQIFDEVYTYEKAMKNVQASSYSTRLKQLQSMNSLGTLSDSMVREICSSDGYPETIMRILSKDSQLSTAAKVKITEGISSRVFKAENSSRIKAQYEIVKGNFTNASNLVSSSSSSGSFFDTSAALLRSGETFSQKAKRFVYYNLVDEAIEGGASKEAAMQQAKLMYSYAMDQVGTKTAKESAANLFKSNASFFGYKDGMLTQFQDTSLSHSATSPFMIQQYALNQGQTINRTKLSEDFRTFMSGIDPTTSKPMYIRPSDVDVAKSLEARDLFTRSFNDAAYGKTGDPVEALKVMSKILELDKNGTSLYVYNNGGKTCSHRSYSTINLANQTISGRSAGTVFHETGHYLFGNVLNDTVPAGFSATRKAALDTLYSAENAELLKTLRTNINEVRIFADYKGTKALTSSLAKQGFSSIDAYKKRLIDSYSVQSATERATTLLNRTTTTGSMYTSTFEKTYRQNFDFDDIVSCANLEINSLRRRVSDSIARSTGSFSTISGMFDSLTMSKDSIWFGHSREYFESASNPNQKVYHELIADYTALRVKGDTQAIVFLRQLFGTEVMDSLEKTYQDMLK